MRIGVRSPRGGRWDTSRILDVVLSIAQWPMANREAIDLSEPPPLLVVEVSESIRSADDRAKYREYSVLEIPEYWIVDSLEMKVMICGLNEGRYDEAIFFDRAVVQSPTLPNLELTVDRILAAGEL